jgi:hypothetical protein
MTRRGHRGMGCARMMCIALATAAALLPSHRVWADSPGTTTAEFLKIGVGPRAAALGSAYTAVADDAYSLYWNPAGLTRIRKAEAVFQANNFFQGIDQHYIALGYRWDKSGVFGISLNALQVADIPRTTVSGAGVVTRTGTFDASDIALSAGFARDLNAWLSAGGAVKWIRSSIASYSADGYAADAGIQVRPASFLSFGASVQNLGTKMKFVRDEDPLPLLYRFGAAGYIFSDKSLVVTADISQSVADILIFGAGCEYTITAMRNRYSFRMGYTSANVDVGRSLTFGFGLRFARYMGFDYAFVPFGLLGNSHRYSMSLVF